MIEKIEVSFPEMRDKIQEIEAANGVITQMDVKPSSYVLTVRWEEEAKA